MPAPEAERAERDLIVMQGDFSIASGAAAAEQLLLRSEPPTAIFCFNDEMAIGVIDTAQATAEVGPATTCPSSGSTTSGSPATRIRR